MPAYHKVAKQANEQIKKIVNSADTMTDEELVKELAYLYNLGIRSGRPVQGTQRLTAVKMAVEGYAVKARLEEVQSDRGSYKKLVLE